MKNVLAAIGVVCIFGGEAFCILGPIQYQDVIHIVCHIILYSGMVLVAGGAALHGVQAPPKSNIRVTESGCEHNRF